jgi:hypothetical protein
MIGRGVPIAKACQPGAVDQEDILPAIIVVIQKRHAGAVRLDDVLLRCLAAGCETHPEAGLLCDINKGDRKRNA